MFERGRLSSFLPLARRKGRGRMEEGREEEGWKKRGRMEEEKEDGRRALVHVVVNDGSLWKLQNLMEINW